MKNIHILPTDKLSRVRIGNNRNFIIGITQSATVSKNDFYTNQHIYIASDEEIKIKDYVINLEDNEIYPSMGYMGNNNWIKKIILTTDQDLINDGVQAIDDEFLEWFIKNPSCDYIHVYNQTTVGYSYDEYHFVFPESGNKEETKQEIPQVGPTEFVTMCENIFGGKPKQETVEEAAKTYIESKFFDFGDLTYEAELNAIEHFIAGAKWQQEQNKNLYSEEDLHNAFYNGWLYRGENYTFPKAKKEWFEQFKKN